MIADSLDHVLNALRAAADLTRLRLLLLCAQGEWTVSELTQILDVYGRKVAAGEWRDYAIDQLKERAVFSIFRRTSEVPLYQIVKQPKLARKQGAYSVINATGYTLKRGHDLANVLKLLDKPLKLVSA